MDTPPPVAPRKNLRPISTRFALPAVSEQSAVALLEEENRKLKEELQQLRFSLANEVALRTAAERKLADMQTTLSK